MKSILQDIYYGNLNPVEENKEITQDYKKLILYQQKKYHIFEQKLKIADESLLPLFLELYNDLFLNIPYENESAFVCGFRIGVRVMIESMQTKYWE